MIVRALDVNHDWTFGKGKNNYLSANKAIAQSIDTRLYSFLGDCFFDTTAGIDWFNLLGGKDLTALKLAISATILNTENVTGLIELSVNLDNNRRITISYSVSTVYTGLAAAGFLQVTASFILTEDGSILTTESGDQIET